MSRDGLSSIERWERAQLWRRRRMEMWRYAIILSLTIFFSVPMGEWESEGRVVSLVLGMS